MVEPQPSKLVMRVRSPPPALGKVDVRPARDPERVIPERLVRFRLRTVLSLLATIIAVAVLLEVIWIARHVLTWIFISLFLAVALNPAVGWFQRHGVKRRGAAAAVTFLLALAFLAAIGFVFVPTLVSQVNDFVQKLPQYAHDIPALTFRLGSLLFSCQDDSLRGARDGHRALAGRMEGLREPTVSERCSANW